MYWVTGPNSTEGLRDVQLPGLPEPVLLGLNVLRRPVVDLLVVVLVVQQLDDQLLLGQGEQL